ncbi:hypothetical protein [Desulforegula conservatrix]|uniref:hypothetical protein n=1 Tax=Desulforegula conservatrix TaxID=153026 RepID=UPI00041B0EEB|nr:hypothetical protein [Desulforegula conservatrix]
MSNQHLYIKFSAYAVVIMFCCMLNGCAWVGTRTQTTCEKVISKPIISTDYGIVSDQWRRTQPKLNAYTLKLLWGPPYKINVLGKDKVEWIYSPNRFNPAEISTWRGSLIIALIVPIPLMLPIGNEENRILLENGIVKRAHFQECHLSTYFLRLYLFSLVHVNSLGFGEIEYDSECVFYKKDIYESSIAEPLEDDSRAGLEKLDSHLSENLLY